MRLFLTAAVRNGWYHSQIYVRAAFLNVPLQEDLYIQQTDGYVQEENESKVLRLHKRMYGFKKAAQACNDHLCEILQTLGFNSGVIDESCFYCSRRTIYLPPYVNEIWMAGPDFFALRLVAKKISERVDLCMEKLVDRFLGISIVRSGRRTTISNSLLVDFITHKFVMGEAKPTPTPIAAVTRIDMSE